MKIYTEEGWINMRECFNSTPFVMIISARGLGKTFGALKFLVDHYRETGEQFIYMRRMEGEADLVATPEGNPFVPIMKVYPEYDVRIRKVSKDVRGFFLDGDEKPCGLIVALSTFYKRRSVSYDEVTNVFYDEFIPEKIARPLKGEAEALFQALETIGRNREIQGRPPLHVVLASNANTIDNPVLLSLGLVNRVMDMVRKHVPIWTDGKDITVIVPFNSPISKAKSETSLYRLTSRNRNDFTRIALDNEFGEEITDNVRPMNLKQYSPVCQIGEIYIYRHKSERRWYVSAHGTGTFKKTYSVGDMGLKRFKREQSRLWMAHLRNEIYFESFVEQMLFESYFA